LACRNRALELRLLEQALAQLPQVEPRADLAARTMATVGRRHGLKRAARPAWRGILLVVGLLVAMTTCLWLIANAAVAFQGAGGNELLNLIGSYPNLLLRYPAETALAVLEALPLGNLTLGLVSALVASFLGLQLIAAARSGGGWPRANGGRL
jgi:hypothetical protein